MQMLLSGSNVMGTGQVCYDLSSGPSTIKDLGLGVAEAPLEVDHRAGICALACEVIWVLEVDLLVRAAWRKLVRYTCKFMRHTAFKMIGRPEHRKIQTP